MTEVTPSPIKQTIAVFKKITIVLLVILLLLIALLSGLVATEKGSQWVVNRAVQATQATIKNTRGNLLTGLDIEQLEYKNNLVSLHAENISFRWQPWGLLYTAVSVQSFSAVNIKIQLAPSEKKAEQENYQWPNLAQPLRVHLQKLDLKNITITQGERITKLTKISGDLNLGTFHLRADDLVVENELGSVKLDGAMNLRYPYALDLRSQWNVVMQTQGTTKEHFSGTFDLTGDIKTLLLKHNLLSPMRIDTSASISPALHIPDKTPFAEFTHDWKKQPLAPSLQKFLRDHTKLNSIIPLESTQGHVAGSGWLDRIALKIELQTSSHEKELTLTGKTNIQRRENNFEIQLDKTVVSLKPLSSKENANRINLSGRIEGFHNWNWNIKLDTSHFNANEFIDTWPSDLQATTNLQGSYKAATEQTPGSLQLFLNDIKLQGDLRKFTVNADGDLEFDGEHWRSPAANIAIGNNHLTIKGEAGRDLALAWNLDAPQLEQIDPSLRGSIASSGYITGDKANPKIQIDTRIAQFVWRDIAIENFLFKLSRSQSSENYSLSADAKHLQWQTQHITSLQLNGSGALANHSVDGKIVNVKNDTIDFSLSGQWSNTEWQGQWQKFIVNWGKFPAWFLASSSLMRWQTNQIFDLGKLCLTSTVNNNVRQQPSPLSNNSFQSPARNSFDTFLNNQESVLSKIFLQDTPYICIQGNWNESKGFGATATLTAVPAAQLHPWLKPEVVLKGVIDGDISLRAEKLKPLLFTGHLQTRDVEFLYQFRGGSTRSYPIKKGSLDLNIKNNDLILLATIDWAKYGTLSAEGKYNLTTKQVQGKANVLIEDLAPLESVLPFLNEVRGSATANFLVSGSTLKPIISGDLNLNKASANLPKLGLTLKDISFLVSNQSNGRLHMDGQITSGEGTLMIKGDLDNLGTPDWHWQGNIFGANIRVIEQPQITATISPNLKLSATKEVIKLTGSTEIPKARAILKSLPTSATRVSSDVVIVNRESLLPESITSKKSTPFLTDIILYFGDDVRFTGFGLDTQLLGKVNVLKEENRQAFTTGFVAVGKGNYKAYGQDLKIERGRLIFQGPYDNPGLDIRASRAIDNITAGLEIAGTLQKPISKVFSVPASSDSEAMAMLLTGKTLSQQSKADAYSLLGAIGSLGMDQNSSMTSDISRKFGIDEITIKSDKDLEQSALWMGKYVTPKLFIRYMVGLFDQAFTVGVRYDVNERIRLEAESGKTESVDIIYRIER